MSGDTPSHRRLLAWFSLGHLANDWAPSTIWIVAPAIAAAMDLSPAEVGLLITIAHVGAALGYLPAGVLADRVANRGRLLLGTFWWVAAGYLAASFAPGFWTLALMLAIAGIGDAAWHPIATGVLAQSLPTRRAHALG
ncbi:MAG: MFS transporter, partial [Alphaproteobacteria bacterium]|nr:MFS transporter [Alphaproteobacteria bacterium]